MSNILDFQSFKNKKQGEEQSDLDPKLERIRVSINNINQLMLELKQTAFEEEIKNNEEKKKRQEQDRKLKNEAVKKAYRLKP